MKTIPCKRCNGTGVEPDRVLVGIQMRSLRASAGVSLTKLAESMGLSVSYISDLELGRRLWSSDLISKAEKAIKKLSK